MRIKCKARGIKKGILQLSSIPLFNLFLYYPSQLKQSGSIAFAAISPRNTDSVRI